MRVLIWAYIGACFLACVADGNALGATSFALLAIWTARLMSS